VTPGSERGSPDPPLPDARKPALMRRLPALITVGAAGRRRPGGPVRGRRRRGRRVRRHVRGDRRRDGRHPVAVVRPGDRAHVGAVVGEPGRRRSLRSLGDGRAVVVRVRVRRAGCRVGIRRLRRLGRLVRLGRLRRLGRARPGGRVGAIRAHREGLPGSGNGSRQAMSGRLGGLQPAGREDGRLRQGDRGERRDDALGSMHGLGFSGCGATVAAHLRKRRPSGFR